MSPKNSLLDNGSHQDAESSARLSPNSSWPLLASAQFIRSTSQTWAPACVPALVAVSLTLAGSAYSIQHFSPWFAELLTPEGQNWDFLRQLLWWFSAALAVYVSLLFSLLVAPTLSAPALERLVRLAEDKLKAPPRPPQSVWFEFACGLKAQAFIGGLTLSCSGVLWVVGSLAPALGPFIVVVQSAIVGCAVAWNLLDYPLTLRGLGVRQRWGLLVRNPKIVCTFGLPFAALFWLPGLGVALLPVGVVAATQVVWKDLLADPEVVQQILSPRPNAARAETP